MKNLFLILTLFFFSCSQFDSDLWHPMELKDRFRGALIGSYLGDSLGKGVEYIYRHNPDKAPKQYVDRKVIAFAERRDSRYKGKWGYHPAGTYTDDTEEMIALLKSLVRNRGFVVQEDLAKELGDSFRYNHGYSSKTSKLLMALKEKPKDWKNIVMTKKRMTYESNGCAMRSTPMGLLGMKSSDGELRDLVTRQCQVTHPSPVSIEGAAIISKAVQIALNTKKREFDPYKFLGELIDFCVHEPLCDRLKEVRVLISKNLKREDEVRILRDKNKIGVGFKILDSIPAAIYFAAKYHHSFEKALNAAVQVSLAGDADTIPAMTGGILGAYHGFNALPKIWLEQLFDGGHQWEKRVKANPKFQDIDFISWREVRDLSDRLLPFSQ